MKNIYIYVPVKHIYETYVHVRNRKKCILNIST